MNISKKQYNNSCGVVRYLKFRHLEFRHLKLRYHVKKTPEKSGKIFRASFSLSCAYSAATAALLLILGYDLVVLGFLFVEHLIKSVDYPV